ncbi:MAG: phage/plasmid primase, P4 family, partial [Candidatus Nitrosocaldus sp.]
MIVESFGWKDIIMKILDEEYKLGIDHIPINHYWNDEKQEWNKTPYAGYDLNSHYEYKAYSTMEELEAYYQEKGCEAYAIRLGKLRDSSNNKYIVGIDVDSREYALLIDAYLKDNGLDTMKEVTPRGGMHFYYLLPEDIRMMIRINGIHTPITPTPITPTTTTPTPTPTTPTNINMLDLAKNTTLDIKLYIEKRYFIHIAKKYQIINGVDKITTLTPDSLDKINDTLSKIIRLTVALKDYYIEGKRDYLWLYLSGYMYKLNVELEEALIICRYVCLFFKDEELKSRLAVVKETYSKDKDKDKKRKEIKGIEGLKELGLSQTILQQIQSIFKNNNNSSNNNINNNNNNNKDIITIEYTYVCQFLLAEREAGIERSLFIDNYRYVCEKDNGGYWIYWDKGVWSAEYAEMKLAKDLLDYCKSVIEELQNEREEFKEELGYFMQVTKSKSALKELMATLSIFLNIPDKLLDSLPDNIILARNCAIEISTSASNSNNNANNNNNNNNNSNNNTNNNTNTTEEIETTKVNVNVKILPLEEVKEYYPTRRLNVEYDPNAKCDRFREFLLTICNNNVEKANFLIRLMGLFLQKRKEEYCFILYGAGANGKSTLLKVITSLLGDYARYSNISMINAREEEGKNPELIACKDKHLICIFEPKQVYLNAANLKAITSLEPKSVRPLYKLPVEVIPDFHLVIATNNKPIITEFTLGMLRRLIMIRFDYIIPEKERISNYADILLEERSGILNLMLAGLLQKKVMQEKEENGSLSLTIPDVIKRETAEWLWEIDSLQEFVDRYLEMTYNDKDRIRFSTVYEKYKFFLQLKGREIEETEVEGEGEGEEGEKRKDKEEEGGEGVGVGEGEGGEENKKILSKVAFSKRLRDLGFTTEKIDKVTYLCRVRWKIIDNNNNNNNASDDNSDNSSDNDSNYNSSSNSNNNSNRNNNIIPTLTPPHTTIPTVTPATPPTPITTPTTTPNMQEKLNSNSSNRNSNSRLITVEESRKVFEHIEKHYYDHDNFYVCKHCKHKHIPLTIYRQGVKIIEFNSLPDNITLGEEQYNRLVELAMHADSCYTYNIYYKQANALLLFDPCEDC